MSLLPRGPRFLFRMDDISVTRPATTANSEGDPDARTAVLAGKGTISTAGPSEMMLASQRGTKVDKILSLELGMDVQAGDVVTNAKGEAFEVVDVEDRRLYRRALMRRAG